MIPSQVWKIIYLVSKASEAREWRETGITS